MDTQGRNQTNTIEYWKLDELAEIIDDFEYLMEKKVSKGMKAAWDYDNNLVFVSSKTIISAKEIWALSAVGYPNGAFALSRNLYEQLITLLFLHARKTAPDFLDYVEDYHLDFERQQNKYLQFRAEKCTKDPAELAKVQAEKDRIRAEAHHKVKGDYWWAGFESFHNFALAAIELESDAKMHTFLLSLHLRYKEACTILHAGSLGNQYYLGVAADFVGVDTLPKPTALGRPLLFFVELLMGIMGIIAIDLDLKLNPDQRTLKERLVGLENYYLSVL